MLGLALSLRESSTAFLKAAVWATILSRGYCSWRGVRISGDLCYQSVWRNGFVVMMRDGVNVSEMAGMEGEAVR